MPQRQDGQAPVAPRPHLLFLLTLPGLQICRLERAHQSGLPEMRVAYADSQGHQKARHGACLSAYDLWVCGAGWGRGCRQVSLFRQRGYFFDAALTIILTRRGAVRVSTVVFL